MPIRPIVRYMLLCEEWRADPDRRQHLSVFGLVTNVVGNEDHSYPVIYRQLCVLLILTELYHPGRAQIVCVSEERGKPVFKAPEQMIHPPGDPLHVHGVSFKIRDCIFPQAGFYSIQFMFDGELVEERSLTVR